MENKNVPCCEEPCVHGDVVDCVQAQLLPDEQLYDLAELFKIFGDSTRVKILYALLEPTTTSFISWLRVWNIF